VRLQCADQYRFAVFFSIDKRQWKKMDDRNSHMDQQFSARRYDSAAYADLCPSVYLPVCHKPIFCLMTLKACS